MDIKNLINFDIHILFIVIITLVVGIFSINLVKFIIIRFIFRSSSKQTKMLFNKLFIYFFYSVLLLIILGQMGISLATILGAAGVFGIAIGIASQKSLGNIISGFFMITEKSFEIGDVLKIGDNSGTVHSVELLSIMLKTFDNKLIRIPNEILISQEVTNITRFSIRRMDIDISVSYKEDLARVIKVLEDIAVSGEFFLDEPKPLIVIKEFGASGIVLQFGIWFQKENFLKAKNRVMIDIVTEFRKNSIEIPFNQLVIHKE